MVACRAWTSRVLRTAAVVGWLSHIGCTAPSGTPEPPPATASAEPGTPSQSEKPATTDDQRHEHGAPHGGSLVELGIEFAHLELVLDAATGTLTGYALDGEAERPVRLSQPAIELTIAPAGKPSMVVVLEPMANPLTGESVGDTSQFRATLDALKGVERFDGTLKRIAIRGQEFANVRLQFPSEAHE
jgi:hypothetical protein